MQTLLVQEDTYLMKFQTLPLFLTIIVVHYQKLPSNLVPLCYVMLREVSMMDDCLLSTPPPS